MNDSLVFRRATLSDLIGLALLRVRFLKELAQDGTKRNENAMVRKLQSEFREGIVNENILVCLAEKEKQIIASSTMIIWQPLSSFQELDKSGKGYVLNMYTIPSYRGQGIATKLLTNLIAEAENRSLSSLHLHATDAGMNLYRTMGFEAPKYPELNLTL